MQRSFTDAGFLMKAISVVLIVLGVFGLVSGFTLAYNVERAGREEEGQVFLEELRLQMAQQLGLPLEDPALQPAEEEGAQTAPSEGEGALEASPEASPEAGAPEEDAAATPEPAPQGVSKEDVLSYFQFVAMLTIFEGMVQLLAGLIGLLRHGKPEAQGLPIFMAIAMLLVWLVRLIFGDGNLLSAAATLVLPGAYLYASLALRKTRGSSGSLGRSRTLRPPLSRGGKRGGNDDWLNRL